MKKILSLFVVMLMCLSFAGCSSKETETKQTLVMATEATFQPYEYYDGDEIVGIDVEIAKAIAKKLGKELEVVDVEFDSIIPGVQAGKYDFGAAGMTVTEERMNEVNFTDSYATGVQVIIVKEDSEIKTIANVTDGTIKNLLVGTQAGTTGFLYSTWDIEEVGLGTVKSFQKTTDAAQALENGQIDCIMLDNEPAKAIVANNGGLKILDSEYLSEDYAIAVGKENTELLNQMNAALKELIADGTVQNIIDKYIGK